MLAISFILFLILHGVSTLEGKPKEECALNDIPGTLLNCIVNHKRVNIEHLTTNHLLKETTCLTLSNSSMLQFRCTGTKWELVKGMKTREIPRRRKRHIFRLIGEGIACLLTFGYTCIWGNRAGPTDRTPPSIACVPSVFKTAEPLKIYAKVNWQEPSPYDEIDGSIKARRYGWAPGRHFPEGSTTIKYVAKDRAGNRAECSTTVNVKVVRCKQIEKVKNGYFQCSPVTEFINGGHCNFGCYEGFDLHGSDTLVCKDNGEWSSVHIPTCQPLKCPVPPYVHGAGRPMCTDEQSFRSICTYHCKRGYDMPAGVSKALVCTKDKSWRKYGEPKCIDVEPPVFTICPSIVIAGTDKGLNSTKVSWKFPTATDNSGKSKIYLEKGKLPGSVFFAGIHKIKYRAKDEAGNAAFGDCYFEVVVRDILCHKLYPTPWVHFDCPDGYRSGVRCNISCDPGKKMVGVDNVGCKQSPAGLFGIWNWFNETQTICKSTHNCAALQPPTNGAVVCDNWEGGQFCQFQCMKGTEMTSVSLNKVYTCNKKGSWSQTLPKIKTCRAISDKNNRRLLGIYAAYYYDGDCTDQSTKKEIADNFIKAIGSSLYQPELCPDTVQCNSKNVQIFCGAMERRKRSMLNDTETGMSLRVLIKLPLRINNNESLLLFEEDYLRLLDGVKLVILNSENEIFNGTSVIQHQLASTGLEIVCVQGSVKSEQSLNCVDCPEGTYYSDTIDGEAVCQACPKGTFQDKAAQLQCIPCPERTTTQTFGSTSPSHCEDACPPGSFSQDGLLPCSPCSQGQYQSLFGQLGCLSCPYVSSTLTYGASSINDCKEFDINFAPEEESDIKLSLPEPFVLTNFTVAFWIQLSTISENTTDDTLTVLSLSSGEDMTDALSLNIIPPLVNNNSFGGQQIILPDERWHYIALSKQNRNITVTIDGMPVQMSPSSVIYTSLTVNSIAVYSTNYTKGSFSQLNVWHGKHIFGEKQRCFKEELGDVLSWKHFEDSVITGAYINIPSQCDDFDNCASSPCLNGWCRDVLHGFECDCYNGFQGTQCEVNIDDCLVNICLNNATCVDGIANYKCLCPHNYTGYYCEVEMVDGKWSEWGSWSECSSTCGDGTKQRIRLCNSPSPDNGGNTCSDDGHGYKACNNPNCTVCPHLHAPVNGYLECSNDTKTINCTISCDEGFDFDMEPLPYYYCGPHTFNEWNFETNENTDRRLPACVEIKMPEELSLFYSANYRNLYCNDVESAADIVEQIDMVVNAVVTNVSCVHHKVCNLTYVVATNCDDTDRQKRSQKAAGFNLQITSRPSEGNGTESMYHLEHGFQTIVRSGITGEFTVVIFDEIYELDQNLTDINGELVCGSGETRVNHYCVPCGKGAYLYTDYCKPCPQGTYQDKKGQLECIQCPQLKTTIGIRSTSVEECAVDVILGENRDLKEVWTVVGLVLAVALIAVAVFTCYKRYKSKQGGFIFSNTETIEIPVRNQNKPSTEPILLSKKVLSRSSNDVSDTAEDELSAMLDTPNEDF